MRKNKAKILSALLAALLLGGLLSLSGCGKESPAGEPEAKTPSVTLTAAEMTEYATLSDAVAAAKEQRKNGYDGDLTVTLAPGDYFEEKTIYLDSDLSGLTIESDPSGEARVIGGYRVEGFAWDEFNGVRCLSAPVRDEDFTDFYVNGERASMTRYPQQGYLYMEDVENHDGRQNSGSRWFIAADGDIGDFRNLGRVWVSFLHLWIDEHTTIESYDSETRRVTMTLPSHFNLLEEGGQPYYLENVAESFGRQNDWYAEGGKVYYVPRDDTVTPETIEAYVPTTDRFIRIEGEPGDPVSGVTLRGIRFTVSRGDYTSQEGGLQRASDGQAVNGADGVLSLQYVENSVIEDCSLTNYGLHGIALESGCHEVRISRCRFRDGGGGGVKMISPSDAEEYDLTDRITVEDCLITHCGRRHMASAGILMIRVGQSVIRHNEIADLFYSGISCGWDWTYEENPAHDNLITKNHIHDIGGPLSDMGGIYIMSAQPGTVVSNNLIHDVTCADYGANGLYADYGTSDVLFEKNIVYRVGTNCFQQSYGANNTIRNNIFWQSGESAVKSFMYEDHVSDILENNIIVTDGTAYYELLRNHLTHKTFRTDRNLLWELSGKEPVSVLIRDSDKTYSPEDAARFFGVDPESVFADPGFADPANGDFTMPEDSPAYELGFEPIDMSDVGPRVSF